MKIIILAGALFLTGCTAANQKYEIGKQKWIDFKIANACIKTSNALHDDPRPPITIGTFPTLKKYSKWDCNDGEAYYSPYGD